MVMVETTFIKRLTAYLAIKQTYWIGIGALLSFNVSLILFALVPLVPIDPNPLLIEEVVIASAASISTIGVVLHAYGYRNRLTRWSFLSSVFAIFSTIVAFCIFGEEASVLARLTAFFYLLTGLFVATCLHIEFGGENPIQDKPQEIPEELL